MRNRGWPILAAFVLVLVLVAVAWLWRRDQRAPVDMSANVVHYLSSGAGGQAYARVKEPRHLEFPGDAGAHPEYRTEWWYYTGNVMDADGRPFGFQLTFFRNAITPTLGVGTAPAEAVNAVGTALTNEPSSDWRTNQVYLAHFALTDPNGEAFHSAERLSRGAAKLAGAQADPFEVWVEGWRAGEVPWPTDNADPPTDGSTDSHDVRNVRLVADDGGYSIDLLLEPAKPVAFHGDGGFSPKGPESGNASYYYSYPRLSTTGTIVTPSDSFEVTGEAWMDHEWSTSALDAETQTGWDWFSLQLDDGREIMVFQIRTQDGGIAPVSSGSLINADGSVVHLEAADFDIEALDTWRSAKTGAVYPSQWQVRVPEHGIDLEVVPLMNDQELETFIRYWEGAVTTIGTVDGKAIGGNGYVELTGYVDGQSLPGTGW